MTMERTIGAGRKWRGGPNFETSVEIEIKTGTNTKNLNLLLWLYSSTAAKYRKSRPIFI